MAKFKCPHCGKETEINSSDICRIINQMQDEYEKRIAELESQIDDLEIDLEDAEEDAEHQRHMASRRRVIY